MRRQFSFASALCLSLCLCARAEDADRGADRRSDQQLLQGTWKVIKRVKNGTAENADEHRTTLKFTGNDIVESRDDKPRQQGTYTLDETKMPKRMTLTGKSGDNAGKTFEAIYEVSGKDLKLAYSIGENAGIPPKDFSGGEGTGLLVLERERS
jgi:uncharacterized protein (TIGR03067 family)